MKFLILNGFQEEEPFLDSDLETDVDEEIDYYPGENLLREKFSGNEEVHRDKSKFSNMHFFVIFSTVSFFRKFKRIQEN